MYEISKFRNDVSPNGKCGEYMTDIPGPSNQNDIAGVFSVNVIMIAVFHEIIMPQVGQWVISSEYSKVIQVFQSVSLVYS